MIGKISTGKSFYYCLRYCLIDKKELDEMQKKELSMKDGLQYKDRAEVLDYNLCFGNVRELSSQFLEVSKLSSRTEKPVLHMQMRLAPEDHLTNSQLIEISQACAEAFGFSDRQYVTVLHKDTNEPHIHIVANRVGFDGKAISLSNDFRRMAELCRQLEKRYGLTSVLSPRPFLPKAQQHLPRHDSRKEKLKMNIRQTLLQVNSWDAFENRMQALGYTLIKGRGISFIDNKKVKTKGSEVGFSLAKIEQALSMRSQMDTLKNERTDGDNQGLHLPSSDQFQQGNRSLSIAAGKILQQLLESEQPGNAPEPYDYKRKKKNADPIYKVK
jgi:hypothetical protein